MAVKVLIVEDTVQLNEMLQMQFQFAGYETGSALDGKTGLDMALTGDYGLVILDLNLPGMDGIEVLNRIRESDIALPVVVLTARDTSEDVIRGLDMGADDYITKPFDTQILMARVRAALRKYEDHSGFSGLEVNGVRIDSVSREVSVSGKKVELTRKEFDLLYELMANRSKVLTRDVLLNKVWGYDFFGEGNTVDVYVRHLRRKLEEPFGISLIETVRGVGYVIR